MLARAKGVVKEGDTVIEGTKIISKEAKRAYADFLRKKAKGDGFIFYYFTVFIYFWLPSNCLNMSICFIMSNNMCPSVSVCVQVFFCIFNDKIEYEGDVYLNNYFERREKQYKDNPDALEALKLLKTVHSQVIGTYGKGLELDFA
jgi:hypothetical protein